MDRPGKQHTPSNPLVFGQSLNNVLFKGLLIRAFFPPSLPPIQFLLRATIADQQLLWIKIIKNALRTAQLSARDEQFSSL